MNQRHLPFWPERRPHTFPVPATSVAHNLAVSAARWPEHPAIVYYDTPIAYGRLWREVEMLAGYLEHEAGVARG
ncbi:MAG: fatty-acyl-CoA synthase, partial [Candidatus Eremiobacteraeota bacterium]|nr:fatty-acyl-CoA synthase [Candidatus Eremiobacteraeota bacterium]